MSISLGAGVLAVIGLMVPVLALVLYRRVPAIQLGLRALLGRLAQDAVLADRIRASLRRLHDPRAGELVHLILGALPPRPRYWLLFPILTVTSVTSLGLFLTVWPPAFVVWLGVCLVNLWVQLAYKPRVMRFVPASRELPAFIGATRALGALDIAEAQEQTTTLRDGSKQLGNLRRAAKWSTLAAA